MNKKMIATFIIAALFSHGNMLEANNKTKKDVNNVHYELFMNSLKQLEKQLEEEELLTAKFNHYVKNSNFSLENVKFIESLSNKYNIEEAWIYKVMEKESGFNSKAVNKITNATGLIQWMPSTAKRYGVTVDEIYNMSISEQLLLLEKYLDNTIKRHTELISGVDTYMAVFYPNAIGKKGSFEIGMEKNSNYAKSCYNANSNIDKVHGNNDGKLTVSDIKSWLNT